MPPETKVLCAIERPRASLGKRKHGETVEYLGPAFAILVAIWVGNAALWTIAVEVTIGLERKRMPHGGTGRYARTFDDMVRYFFTNLGWPLQIWFVFLMFLGRGPYAPGGVGIDKEELDEIDRWYKENKDRLEKEKERKDRPE